MSIFYCFVCDKHIDSDYDAEHLESCPDEDENEQDHGIDPLEMDTGRSLTDDFGDN